MGLEYSLPDYSVKIRVLKACIVMTITGTVNRYRDAVVNQRSNLFGCEMSIDLVALKGDD